MSDEELFELLETTLQRTLTADERKFLILANETRERNRLQSENKSQAKGASTGWSS
jgi:hypothetical protein